MNIGVDFDGVIVDTEACVKYEFEKYAFLTRGLDVKSRAYRRMGPCFDLSPEERRKILKENLVDITLTCGYKRGVKEVLEMLRERGHKLFLVTARNNYNGEEELTCARKRLDDLGFKFDNEFWFSEDKVKACNENGITVMIEDCNQNCRLLSEAGIHTLYFREKGYEKLPEGKYLVDVYNWMHIFKEVLKIERYSENPSK